jgi:hypothetical protein
MKKTGPPYRFLPLGLGILEIFLLIAGWGLVWVYMNEFTLDPVTLIWIGATLALPILQIIGGLGYACCREGGRLLVDRLALVGFMLAALAAGACFGLAAILLVSTQPRAEFVAPDTFVNWSIVMFFLGIILVLLMLGEVLLRGILWKPGVMLFFKPEASRADLRRKLLLRMGLAAPFPLLLGGALVWIWRFWSR